MSQAGPSMGDKSWEQQPIRDKRQDKQNALRTAISKLVKYPQMYVKLSMNRF